MDPDSVELDVRPLLAAGREPLAAILNHLGTLEPGQSLRITAPFFPEPLVAMLQGQGWHTESNRVNATDWQVTISRTRWP